MKYDLRDQNKTVTSGYLKFTVTPHGHQIEEAKTYVNRPGFDRPTVIFYDNEIIILELKSILRGRARPGWSGAIVRHGIKYGANVNAIVNRSGRYGITVWTERLDQVSA